MELLQLVGGFRSDLVAIEYCLSTRVFISYVARQSAASKGFLKKSALYQWKFVKWCDDELLNSRIKEHSSSNKLDNGPILFWQMIFELDFCKIWNMDCS
ncbi:hypothetical protein AVEN_203820-1 [Araneus ventricosus]|uniref:Uncharacterized protein n=1 Tax=Araneus ventricosus TaxID=182803 RepID=A0A4Y2HYR8_ARAVE|nr:hypothetical protein AVEN_203820-1 [Araneus ventricosus]